MEKNSIETEGHIAKDHAAYARKVLAEDLEFAGEWDVVVADDNVLQIDYDILFGDTDEWRPRFNYVLAILKERLDVPSLDYEETPSRHDRTHIVIYLPVPMDIVERVAWQAIFNSDYVREALHLKSISRQELNPILLYMRKPLQLTEGEKY